MRSLVTNDNIAYCETIIFRIPKQFYLGKRKILIANEDTIHAQNHKRMKMGGV